MLTATEPAPVHAISAAVRLRAIRMTSRLKANANRLISRCDIAIPKAASGVTIKAIPEQNQHRRQGEVLSRGETDARRRRFRRGGRRSFPVGVDKRFARIALAPRLPWNGVMDDLPLTAPLDRNSRVGGTRPAGRTSGIEPARIYRLRTVARAEALDRGRLRLCPGARRDLRLEAAQLRALLSRLKDSEAVIDAVCWRDHRMRLGIRPEDGMEVVCTGRLTTYPGRSKYQLVVDTIELAGIGALLKLLEERRKRLDAEGLFAAERKKKLPFLPEVIGIVTSPSGAVIRDILHRLSDRFPRRVLLWPVAVQGEGAAAQIAAAIDGFNRLVGGWGACRAPS